MKIDAIVEYLSEEYGFDLTEAQRKVRDRMAKGEVARVPLPYSGKLEGGCRGMRVNYGLFTQCCRDTVKDGEYCKTCERQATMNDSGEPNGGNIKSRMEGTWTGVATRYANVMEKLKITREVACAAAAKRGQTIAEEEFTVEKRGRGRPRNSTSTSSSDDESKPKRTRGRPKGKKKVIEGSIGDDLISQLVAAAESSDLSCSTSDESDNSVAKKQSSDAAKAEKEAAKKAKEEAKAEKEAAKEEAKAEKEAAKKAKEEAKAEKEAAKEEAKASKLTKKATMFEADKAETAMLIGDLGTLVSPKNIKCDINLDCADEEMVEDDYTSDEAGDEVSLEVEKTMVEGKEYLIDRSTMFLYDIDTHGEVGVWDEESKTIQEIILDE